MTLAQILTQAALGLSQRNLETRLGRKLTSAEEVAFANGVAKRTLETARRQARSPQSSAEKVARHRARAAVVPYRTPPANIRATRTRMERNLEKWLRYYLADRFKWQFGDGHRKIINAAKRAIKQQTPITVAAPRGDGKTSVLWGIALYWVLTGKCRFPFVIGWKSDVGRESVEQWLQALSENERLAEAYPNICDVFRESTAGLRLKRLTREEGGEPCGANVRKSENLIILPAAIERSATGKITRRTGQAVLGAGSINGSIKGKNIGLVDGSNLRPDLVLLDDPQDVPTANSPAMIKSTISAIDYGVRSLSDAKKRLVITAAVTCVKRGDVAEYLLTRPGTEAIRYGQILQWPDGWDDVDGATRRHWAEWNRLRVEGLENLDGGKAARRYYLDNRKAMTRGMKVSWNERKTENDPDAFYAAMWDYYDLGEAVFMAERQNEPMTEGATLFTLTPETIVERTNHEIKANVVPEWANTIIASTDINRSYAMKTTLLAFGTGRRAQVLDYWQRQMACQTDMTDDEIRIIVTNTLATMAGDIKTRPNLPRLWTIDGGGTPAGAVIEFTAASQRIHGLQAITCFGRASTNYKPTATNKKRARRDYEEAHIVAEGMRAWCIWNADYWREMAQRAWTGTPTAPGTCELPAGRHIEFAKEIANEILIDKKELGGRMAYRWETKGTHDYGDTMAQGYMGAALLGIGGSGFIRAAPKMRKPRIRMVTT